MRWIARAKDRYLWSLQRSSNMHQTRIITDDSFTYPNQGNGFI
jgi:hypothetical protein